MNKVNAEEILRILRDARKQNRPWTELAQALRELEALSQTDESGRPWIQRAETESGYSANQLRRMAKVAQYQSFLTKTEPELASKLLERPFSHVEMISKIWSLDEEQGRDLITRPGQTFRDLLGIYGTISETSGGADPIAAGKKAAKQFREKALGLIKRDPRKLYDGQTGLEFEILRPIVPFRYASPDYYVVGRDDGKVARIDAIDCYALYGGSQKDAALRKMILVATECTFFTRFWIVIPEGESADTVLWECDDLKLANVGIILVGVDQRVHWPRQPLGPPVPDRRGLWTDYDKTRLRRDGEPN